MCLSTVYYGKKKKAELAKLPDTVKCWKVVIKGRKRRAEECYWPPLYDCDAYDVGWNETKPRRIGMGYYIAYHAFLNRKEARQWMNSSQKIVQSRTEKKDIVAIGKQGRKLVIVTKRIWIPKPKKKRA